MKKKGDVAESKKKTVAELVKLFDEYKIIGILNMKDLPAKQLQRIKKTLREQAKFFMTKRRLMKIAIEKTKDKDLEKIIPCLEGMPALLFTKEDPFQLATVISKNKSKAPIKPGQETPNDIKISAGPTSFMPGPIIGELGSVGIKTSIQDGKLKIEKDTIVAKQGDIVDEKLAGILSRFGIEPVEVGLNLVAAYDNGTIYEKDILFVDEQEYIDNIQLASANALALAMETGIFTDETIKILLSKAHQNALCLALETDILTNETINNILSKADAQSKLIKSMIKEV
ncbi:MAG: 50S ribosomal protein L10 [Candidatus Woesearchaeota archaeon]|nr:50S ribosomal protein L10 [Candidatus Woesearchaeota archaeon]